jgi:pathogenesis-related protein 1
MLFRTILLLAAVACTLDAQTTSDWLFLSNGAKIQGTFISGDSQKIRFRSADGTTTDYNRADVNWIKLGSAADASSSAAQSPADSNPTPTPQPGSVSNCMKDPPPNVPANTGSNVPVDQARLALQFHNCARAEVGTSPLMWSPGLAAHAQTWANHLATQENCKLIHTTNNPYGQNLFSGTGADWTALDAAHNWYNEKKQYHYAVVNQNNWYPTGHYTQMIWSSTTSIGMGQAACPGGGIVIAAEYNPPGNYLGQAPY